MCENKLTGKVRIVVLHVTAPGLVQNAQLFLIRLGNVAKVLLIRAVDVLGVGHAFLVPQMIPVGRSEGDFQVFHLFGLDKTRQPFEIVDVRAALVLDLARADDCLARLDFFLDKG